MFECTRKSLNIITDSSGFIRGQICLVDNNLDPIQYAETIKIPIIWELLEKGHWRTTRRAVYGIIVVEKDTVFDELNVCAYFIYF